MERDDTLPQDWGGRMMVLPGNRREWWSDGQSDQTLPFIHTRHVWSTTDFFIDFSWTRNVKYDCHLCVLDGDKLYTAWSTDGEEAVKARWGFLRPMRCPRHEMRADR